MESVIRGVGIYVVLLVIFRLSGRRTMSEMTPFDFVLLLIVAETTQQALLGEDFSLTNAAILAITLFSLDVAMSYAKRGSRLLRLMLDGTPTILIDRGEPDLRALARARIALSDVLEAARSKQGLERLDQIRYAVLEAGGHVSIVPETGGSTEGAG
jgi:uncharacterized membrane protein YcaP (DUF421 family)